MGPLLGSAVRACRCCCPRSGRLGVQRPLVQGHARWLARPCRGPGAGMVTAVVPLLYPCRARLMRTARREQASRACTCTPRGQAARDEGMLQQLSSTGPLLWITLQCTADEVRTVGGEMCWEVERGVVRDGVEEVTIVLSSCTSTEGMLPRERLQDHDAQSPDVILQHIATKMRCDACSTKLLSAPPACSEVCALPCGSQRHGQAATQTWQAVPPAQCTGVSRSHWP